jgi:hemerythrin
MAIMEWDKSLEVGVVSINEQHRKLIRYLNDLHDAMKAKKSREVLGKILDNLIDYTATHFKYEEDLFLKTKYADAEKHKKEHEALVKQVLDFQSKFKAGNVNLSIDLMQFLSNWVTNHIKGTDMKYKDWFIKNGVK